MNNLIPKLIVDGVTDITVGFLAESHIAAIILDVDNTLTEHGSQTLSDNVSSWLEAVKSAGIKLTIVSNNTEKRIKPFAEKLGLSYVAMGMKPMTKGFKSAQRRFGCPNEKIMVIGDQIYTDIWGGNRLNMFTVLVTPIKVENGFFFKIKRLLEQPIIKKYHKKGC